MTASQLHERVQDLSRETLDMHRALVSLIEELEAVDWYAQRIDASEDGDLRAVLTHSRDEEKEHACMTLEWIRRRDAVFDEQLRRFLFRAERADPREHGDDGAEHSLGIGSLRREETPA